MFTSPPSLPKVVENTAQTQAVCQRQRANNAPRQLQASFWPGSSLKVDASRAGCWRVTLSHPGLVLLRSNTTGPEPYLVASVAYPVRLDVPLEVMMTLEGEVWEGPGCAPGPNGSTVLTFELPAGDMSGASTTLSCRQAKDLTGAG